MNILKMIPTILLLTVINLAQSFPVKSYEYAEKEIVFRVDFVDRCYTEGDTIEFHIFIKNKSKGPAYAFKRDDCTDLTELCFNEEKLVYNVIEMGAIWQPQLGHFRNENLYKIGSQKNIMTTRKMVVSHNNDPEKWLPNNLIYDLKADNFMLVQFLVGIVLVKDGMNHFNMVDGWANLDDSQQMYFFEHLRIFSVGPMLIGIKIHKI